MRILLVIFLSTVLYACGSNGSSNAQLDESLDSNNEAVENFPAASGNANSAAVVTVAIRGESNAYNFLVTVRSPDIGCSQYADWWEVIRPDGSLVYRRILTHSHVDEQPFARSGGPVNLVADENAIVRVHMNSLGYSERVLTGNVQEGFTLSTLSTSFAQTLEFSEPLPEGCAF